MNKAVAGTVAALVLLVAVGGGYWFGTQRGGRPAQVAGSPGDGSAQGTTKGGTGSPGSGDINVEAVKVATASLPQTITAVGSLRSDESVTLRPEVAGRISVIAFQEGQPVAKGAMLVRLDPAVPQAEAAQARANLVLAKTKFDRAVDLAKSNFISGQAKDEAENNLQGGGSVAATGRGEAGEDGPARAVLRRHRPARRCRSAITSRRAPTS